MRIVWCTVFAVLILTGCSQEGSDDAGQGGLPNPAASRITYARIGPQNATSGQQLFVEYTAKASEEQTPEYAFRWYVDGALVPEATGNTLDPEYFGKGAIVEAEVIPRDGSREGGALRTDSVTIRNSPPIATGIELSPIPAFSGDAITAAPSAEDRDGDTVSFLYEWEVNNKVVPGATGLQFDTKAVKKKSMIAVTIIPFDGEDRGSPLKSYSLALSNRVPEFTSEPPSGFESKYVYQVTARDTDRDILSYSLVTAPKGMTINPSSGLISWEPKPVLSREEVSVKVAVSDGDGGTAYQEYSLILEPGQK